MVKRKIKVNNIPATPLSLGANAHFGQVSHGLWRALICAASGIAVAIPVHAGYNYLVSRINKIVLDMERAAAEIVNIVTENGNGKPS